MLSGRINDIKNHEWFLGLDWEALEARRMTPPRLPQRDSDKRIAEIIETEAKEERVTEDAAEVAECDVVFANF